MSEEERTAPATGAGLCPECAGSGLCPMCNGSASVIQVNETITCPDCTSGVCPSCNGSGRSAGDGGA